MYVSVCCVHVGVATKAFKFGALCHWFCDHWSHLSVYRPSNVNIAAAINIIMYVSSNLYHSIAF